MRSFAMPCVGWGGGIRCQPCPLGGNSQVRQESRATRRDVRSMMPRIPTYLVVNDATYVCLPYQYQTYTISTSASWAAYCINSSFLSLVSAAVSRAEARKSRHHPIVDLFFSCIPRNRSTPLARRRAFSVEEAAGDNSEGRHVPGDVKGSGDDKEVRVFLNCICLLLLQYYSMYSHGKKRILWS